MMTKALPTETTKSTSQTRVGAVRQASRNSRIVTIHRRIPGQSHGRCLGAQRCRKSFLMGCAGMSILSTAIEMNPGSREASTLIIRSAPVLHATDPSGDRENWLYAGPHE